MKRRCKDFPLHRVQAQSTESTQALLEAKAIQRYLGLQKVLEENCTQSSIGCQNVKAKVSTCFAC